MPIKLGDKDDGLARLGLRQRPALVGRLSVRQRECLSDRNLDLTRSDQRGELLQPVRARVNDEEGRVGPPFSVMPPDSDEFRLAP